MELALEVKFYLDFHVHSDERWPTEVTSNTYFRGVRLVCFAGLAGDGGVMDGLRSELSAIVERSRMGDRKQQELEQLITKLEDEVSRASAQNIQLEERLADKMAQIAAMESKLGQRNLRVVDLQRELEGKITEINGLQRDVSVLQYPEPELSFAWP